MKKVRTKKPKSCWNCLYLEYERIPFYDKIKCTCKKDKKDIRLITDIYLYETDDINEDLDSCFVLIQHVCDSHKKQEKEMIYSNLADL